MWWNPPQALIGAVIALLGAWLIGRLLLWSLRGGVERSLRRRHRGQERLSAALDYSLAWTVPLIPAGLVLVLRPLLRMSVVGGWSFQLEPVFIYLPAAVLGAMGILLWWFGLIRLALTAPVRSRGRVLLAVLWAPLAAGGLPAAAVFGLLHLRNFLLPVLRLQW